MIDCLVLIVRRLLNRQSPFHADRTHAHHLMLDGGFSVTGVVLTMCAISLTLGLGAAVALKLNVPQPWLTGTFVLLTLSYLLFTRKPEFAIAAYRRLTAPFRKG